mmetsp:Transcript_49717/g.97235  ORF Transcript_49717/g.97235 Transcript_49717/m.97235 type:complete len:564 (+) Transcript_49717:100-1791(+)
MDPPPACRRRENRSDYSVPFGGADYQTIEIFLSCRGLRKMDLLSNTDAFVVFGLCAPETVPFGQGRGRRRPTASAATPTELGRTEVVRDCADPEFVTSFRVEYHFGEVQEIVLDVFDEDVRGSEDLRKHDFLGTARVTLGQIMGSYWNCCWRDLKTGGRIIVRAEKVSEEEDRLALRVNGFGLKNKDGIFGKSDPFLAVSRVNGDRSWTTVWRSEVVMDDLSPKFRESQIQLRKLCNGDVDRPLRIEIFDWNRNGVHQHMGLVETCVREIMTRPSFEVMYKNKKKKGTLAVEIADVIRVPTAVNYILGGCEISLMVAIDFTGSNGNPFEPGTLHYRDPDGIPNEYQAAIAAVGDIIQEYDTDRKFPVWGFGARTDGAVEHCFRVGSHDEVVGVKGILDAYEETFRRGITLSGPTLFSPLLAEARRQVRKNSERTEQSYGVLLILTDGIIDDMDLTVDQICEASDEPLSIVVVGVGGADFSGMDKLDGDRGPLISYSGKLCSRDIVQFVPFRKYSSNVSRLASETLAEIPDQLVQYFTKREILPNYPVQGSSLDGEEKTYCSKY